MTIFYYNILKAITCYKAILRKTLTPTKSEAKIYSLGIKRAQLKNVNDTALHKIGLKILKELQHTSTKHSSKKQSANFHIGLKTFSQHLQDLLNNYTIEENTVINIPQQAANSLVTVIQLINQAQQGLNDNLTQQIYQHTRVIAQYADSEQKNILHKILYSHQPLHMNLLFRQLSQLIQPSPNP
ncbi:MAG: hypothetical protein ACD_82C00139G0001 [uncultured bacterium]|nr:MAG: hypothetical protein ACD_82C00139G0001 [uncultured bacterium]